MPHDPDRGWVFGLGLLFCVVMAGCSQPTGTSQPGGEPRASEAAIRRFCGDCHAFPQPDTYPQHEWPEKVREGFNFYFSSLRSDLEVPSIEAVEQYYADRSPNDLEVVVSTRRVATPEESLFAPAESFKPNQPLRAVAHLRTVTAPQNLRELLICDMRSGNVWQMAGMADAQQPTLLGQCFNACHVEPTDLNGDGQTDYVVADLGSFIPEDHSFGAVWLLHRDPQDQWMKTPLAEGLGRVADVQPLDADGDGDIDLVVAEFGWRTTGRILLLRNEPNADGSPHMTIEVVDERHGTIHVPVTDLNGDGHPDFVALISQEHEAIEAFLNRGDGTFERNRIFTSDNPGFGSSGIQLADMDSDGDLDVLYANGDSLDTPIAKPYHGVRWLENSGTYPYVIHEICTLPGAHCVRAADIDGDGDTDIAVVTLLPGNVVAENPAGTFDSIVWLEQQDDGRFLGHSLERDHCLHAACELADWDADGDLDLIVGDLAIDPSAEQPLTIFLNRTFVPVTGSGGG